MLGHLAVRTANGLSRGSLKADDASFGGGRIGAVQLQGDNVMLGKPFVINDSNINGFDF